jgi:hypothetical protein
LELVRESRISDSPQIGDDASKDIWMADRPTENEARQEIERRIRQMDPLE